MKKLLKTFMGSYKPFDQLELLELPNMLRYGLSSPIYYTPKIQLVPYSNELGKYLRFLTRKTTITKDDLRKLTEAIITEYGQAYKPPTKIQNPLYCVDSNYKIKQSPNYPYHGTVSYLVSLSQKHFLPIQFFSQNINQIACAAIAYHNMLLKNDIRGYPSSGFCLGTTGQQWQLLKVHKSLNLQKTQVFEGRNYFKNLQEDQQMVAVVLGLIDFGLDFEREEEEVLRLAYQYADARKYMIPADHPKQAKQNSWVSKLLVKYEEWKDSKESK